MRRYGVKTIEDLKKLSAYKLYLIFNTSSNYSNLSYCINQLTEDIYNTLNIYLDELLETRSNSISKEVLELRSKRVYIAKYR